LKTKAKEKTSRAQKEPFMDSLRHCAYANYTKNLTWPTSVIFQARQSPG
jgi:hypothetical protein